MSELFKLILVIVETAVRDLALGAAERRQQWETDPVPVHFLDVLSRIADAEEAPG